MAFAPASIVEAPARAPLPFGLFSVLTPRTDGAGRWQNGVEFESLTCEPADGISDPSCDTEVPTEGLPKSFVDGGLTGEATPFIIYGSYVCSPVGYTIEYAQERATMHLLSREEARVEQAISTGDLGAAGSGFIASATAVGVAGDSLAESLAALEVWIATEYGSVGVIHMDRGTATLAVAADLVRVKGNSLQTSLGTPVVAGAGYAAAQTIYATPAMLGYRSEPFPGASPASAGLDRANNDLYAVSERSYVIGWDPCGTAAATYTMGT